MPNTSTPRVAHGGTASSSRAARRARGTAAGRAPAVGPGLVWPKRPTPKVHSDLGRMFRWRSSCGGYRVDRYRDVPGTRFHALQLIAEVWVALAGSPYKTLDAAMRACDRHAAESGSQLRQRKEARDA